MQRKFEKLYRGILIALFVLVLWSVWRATAQTTNAPADMPTVAGSTNASRAAAAADNEPLATPEWAEDLTANVPFLKRQLWGNELWKYLFSLVYIFLAFYVSKLLDYLTRVWLKQWAAIARKTKFDDLVLDLLNGPVKVVAFMIFLRIGLDVFDWPAMVQSVLTKGFTVIVAITLTYMVLKFIDLAMTYWRQRTRRRPTANSTSSCSRSSARA